MKEDLEQLLDRALEIEKTVGSIDSALQDQFHAVDGVTYAAQQSWVKLINIEVAITRIQNSMKAVEGTVVLIFVAVVAHVVHHW